MNVVQQHAQLCLGTWGCLFLACHGEELCSLRLAGMAVCPPHAPLAAWAAAVAAAGHVGWQATMVLPVAGWLQCCCAAEGFPAVTDCEPALGCSWCCLRSAAWGCWLAAEVLQALGNCLLHSDLPHGSASYLHDLNRCCCGILLLNFVEKQQERVMWGVCCNADESLQSEVNLVNPAAAHRPGGPECAQIAL